MVTKYWLATLIVNGTEALINVLMFYYTIQISRAIKFSFFVFWRCSTNIASCYHGTVAIIVSKRDIDKDERRV